MSYSAMSHQSAGYVVTASNYNQFTDNDAACAVAAFTTKGDLFPATGSAAGARLAAGSNFFAPIYHSGETTGLFAKAVPVCIFSDATEISVANTTTETEIQTAITLAANWLTTKNWLQINLWDLSLNNKGTDGVLTYKLYYGSNTYSYAITMTSGATSIERYLRFYLRAEGGASTQRASVEGLYVPSSGGVGGIGLPSSTISTDATSAQTLKLTVTLDAASASFYCKKRVVEVLFHGTTQ